MRNARQNTQGSESMQSVNPDDSMEANRSVKRSQNNSMASSGNNPLMQSTAESRYLKHAVNTAFNTDTLGSAMAAVVNTAALSVTQSSSGGVKEG